MNGLIDGFKDCAHQAAEVCGVGPGRLIRDFGLKDFLDNKLEDDDDAATIAVKAIGFFCDEVGPHHERFKFTVLAVGIFLNESRAGRTGVPTQALRDLVAILRAAPNDQQIHAWIKAHF